MNCDQFRHWLENRDLSDQSESDKALDHRAQCEACNLLYRKDTLLDQVICNGLERQSLPENLERIVSLNLGTSRRSLPRIPPFMIRTVSALAGIAALFALFLLVPTDYSKRNDYGKYLVQDHIMHNYGADFDPIDNLDLWLANHDIHDAVIPNPMKLPQSFRLVSGRVCFIDDCRTIHLVYRSGKKMISLYISKASEVNLDLTERKSYSHTFNSYNIKLFKDAKHLFALVI